MPDPCVNPRAEVLTRLLCLGSEHGIPAAHVRQQRMLPSRFIPQLHAVLFAWASAILIAGPCREEPAEHAMLGMKHRQMLVGDRFYPLAASRSRQFRDLRSVQVMRWSESGNSSGEI